MTIETIKEQLMNSSFRAICTFALVVFALTLFAGTSTFAQTFRGTILGSVTDSSGAAVPGATVTIRNVDTGLVRTVTTSEDGSYSAPELPIGTYSVSVEKACQRWVCVSVNKRANSESSPSTRGHTTRCQ